METCFIFGAGKDTGLVRPPAPGDYVIAADGGYLACRRAGIVPDLLLGDFDSLPEKPDFEKILQVPVEKDDTDTFLAAKYALERGCRTFHIYGGTGGRLDHTLANLQLLVWLSQRGSRGYLYDETFTYTAITDGGITIPRGPEWGLLSVFCMGPDAEGVFERGVQYPLTDAVLTAEFPLGVSNHIIEAEAQISVRKGSLLIGWERSAT